MKWLILFGVIFILADSGLSLAHGTAFFEFAPDYFSSRSLAVAFPDTLAQIFIPQNDFLGGIDLWFDNAGEAGIITFELRDDQNNLLLSKGVTISHLDPVSGGQRYHLDFPQVAVGAVKKYSLFISSVVPQLQIYASDRIRFLQHNASYTSEYLNGAAKVGSEEKEFSFKFALYEGVENVPSVISNRLLTYLGDGRMQLDFNANEPVDYTVFWGLSGGGYSQNLSFTGSYQFCGAGISFCSAVLQGTSGQTYDYQLTAKDSWGNEKSVTGIFTIPAGAALPMISTPTPAPSSSFSVTPAQVDTTPPVISNLRVVKTDDHSVEVAWQTDEAADSSLLISFTTELLSIAAAYDNTAELEHVLNSGATLNQDTPYLATVTSRDPANNVASASISFKTAKLSAGVTPTPNVTPVAVTPNNWTLATPLGTSASQTSSSGDLQIAVPAEEKGAVVISWTPPVDAEGVEGYRIDIFNNKHELVRSITVPVGTKEQKISNLPEGEYRAVVYANDQGVFRKVASSTAFSVDHRSLADKLFASWLYLAGPLIVLLLLVLRFLHKKSPALLKK